MADGPDVVEKVAVGWLVYDLTTTPSRWAWSV